MRRVRRVRFGFEYAFSNRDPVLSPAFVARRAGPLLQVLVPLGLGMKESRPDSEA